MSTPSSSDGGPVMGLVELVATLERRIQHLEDERAIVRRLGLYGHCLDSGDEARFEDCWTADARLHWPAEHGGVLVGREAIMTAFRRHTHAPAVFHKHFLLTPDIHLDGDEASVVSMYARLDAHDEGPRLRSFGRYVDALVRCDDGAWRFVERRAQQECQHPDATPGAMATGQAPLKGDIDE